MNGKKLSINLLKITITSLAIVFLALIFKDSYIDIKSSKIFASQWIFLEIILLTIIYSFSLFTLAYSWRLCVIFLSQKKLSNNLVWIWVKSNIYKYLPGNFANYAVRFIVIKKFNVSYKVLIQSFFYEVVFLSTSSFILSGILFLILGKLSEFQYSELFSFNVSLFALISLIIFLLFYKYKKKYINLYLKLLIYYFIFFFGIGLCAYYIINFQMQINFSFLFITAIYSFAWLVGYITPGAPGGLGVRESVFVILSNNIISSADALLLSLMVRFISILGEIFLYFVAEYKLKLVRG
jgi:uncharacterized membrane protein YbhN (UPF0104 family)